MSILDKKKKTVCCCLRRDNLLKQQTPRPLAQDPDGLPPLELQSLVVRQVPSLEVESLVRHVTGWTCAKTRNTAKTHTGITKTSKSCSGIGTWDILTFTFFSLSVRRNVFLFHMQVNKEKSRETGRLSNGIIMFCSQEMVIDFFLSWIFSHIK